MSVSPELLDFIAKRVHGKNVDMFPGWQEAIGDWERRGVGAGDGPDEHQIVGLATVHFPVVDKDNPREAGWILEVRATTRAVDEGIDVPEGSSIGPRVVLAQDRRSTFQPEMRAFQSTALIIANLLERKCPASDGEPSAEKRVVELSFHAVDPRRFSHLPEEIRRQKKDLVVMERDIALAFTPPEAVFGGDSFGFAALLAAYASLTYHSVGAAIATGRLSEANSSVLIEPVTGLVGKARIVELYKQCAPSHGTAATFYCPEENALIGTGNPVPCTDVKRLLDSMSDGFAQWREHLAFLSKGHCQTMTAHRESRLNVFHVEQWGQSPCDEVFSVAASLEDLPPTVVISLQQLLDFTRSRQGRGVTARHVADWLFNSLLKHAGHVAVCPSVDSVFAMLSSTNANKPLHWVLYEAEPAPTNWKTTAARDEMFQALNAFAASWCKGPVFVIASDWHSASQFSEMARRQPA